MTETYIYKGKILHGEKGYDVIRRGASKYLRGDSNITDEMIREAVIDKEKKGKPFFRDLPVEFSLSNSCNLWVCTFSDRRCGTDVQEIRDGDFYRQISERFYLPDEIEYVREKGRDAFFDIWIRRESFGKYTGEGFFGDMPVFVSDGQICNQVKYENRVLFFHPLKHRLLTEEKQYRGIICTDDSKPGNVHIL